MNQQQQIHRLRMATRSLRGLKNFTAQIFALDSAAIKTHKNV